MLEIDEATHIHRTQNGDTEAFGPIVEKYQSRVYTHIHGRVRDPELAKDLTQETWLKAFRGLNGFRADAAFYSWLYRIAENVCIDYFRKQKHRTSEPLQRSADPRSADSSPCPSHDTERAELRLILQTAIRSLSDARREVFVLYYHHELPVAAIATRLNRSQGTVKTHLRNARLHLQERLRPYLNNADCPAP
ncbi:sigma-70 family RNA polymerase sigma factor [Candidatus Poribacteria bacterium]|nr:sigma-70 family RNA polymerase sigma factor [Candidatus Poribacteria bacterium]